MATKQQMEVENKMLKCQALRRKEGNEAIKDLKAWVTLNFADKKAQVIAYGLVTLVCVGVVSAIVSQVLKK